MVGGTGLEPIGTARFEARRQFLDCTSMSPQHNGTKGKSPCCLVRVVTASEGKDTNLPPQPSVSTLAIVLGPNLYLAKPSCL